MVAIEYEQEGKADQGIEIYAVAANNAFSSPMPEFREARLLYVRETIRMTAVLGAKVLRVFLGLPRLARCR